VSPDQLQQYLYEQIPLSRAMGARVVVADAEGVVLEAPLGPNVNHHRTVFGGSASALAMLSSWALVHVRLHQEEIPRTLVIQRSSMEFERPITEVFSAHSALEHPHRWPQFVNMLHRRGKARVAVTALVRSADAVVARFSGEFVALNLDST
jgi:thioesterase domain-containing protein